MKRTYGTERTKKKILIELEFKTLEKLQKIKMNTILKERKNQRIKAVTVNPFLAVMYKNMSFKAWAKIYRNNKNNNNNIIQNQMYQKDRRNKTLELKEKALMRNRVRKTLNQMKMSMSM